MQGGSASPHHYGVQLACSILGIIKDWTTLVVWYEPDLRTHAQLIFELDWKSQKYMV